MKLLQTLLITAALTTLATTALAEDGSALASKNGCLSCHAVDHKIIGPSYKDVAKKYKGEAGAEDKLVAKVRKGGAGVWGTMPMPANTKPTDAELHTIVKWILAQ